VRIELIKDDKVVVLWLVAAQTEMLPKERQQLVRGSVVCQLDGRHALSIQHGIKEMSTQTSSLTAFMDIKVKHTQWADFFERVVHTCEVVPCEHGGRYKQTFCAHLDEAKRTSVFYHQIDSLTY